jgi:hypothetical protein
VSIFSQVLCANGAHVSPWWRLWFIVFDLKLVIAVRDILCKDAYACFLKLAA